MEMMIWNMVLTTLVAVLSFFMKNKFEALDRVTILLNKTREEIAREHVTRAEMNIVDKLGERFDRSFERLESKLDSFAGRS
jgi:hypothetical protein